MSQILDDLAEDRADTVAGHPARADGVELDGEQARITARTRVEVAREETAVGRDSHNSSSA